MNERIQNQFEIENKENGDIILVSRHNERAFQVGKFRTPTLAILRNQGLSALNQRKLNNHSQHLIYEHISVQDLVNLHSYNSGAVFQAASQFNCLEFCSPNSLPEEGIEIY